MTNLAEIKDNQNAVKKRRWWLAALLIPVLGIGYLYVGRPRRYAFYVIWCTLFLLLFFIPQFVTVIASPIGFYSYVTVTILAVLVFMVDAARLAWKATDYRLGRCNSWWAYGLGIAVYCALSFVPDIVAGVTNRPKLTYSAASISMAPNLVLGDYFTVAPVDYDKVQPERGDVILFRFPQDTSIIFIMRLIGLPGDTIKLENGVIFLNGVAVERKPVGPKIKQGQEQGKEQDSSQPGEIYTELLPNGRSYQTLDANPDSAGDNTQTFTVPSGHYFFLGDNRDYSSDSRFDVGFVPQANLQGKVGFIYWSATSSRIGTPLN